VPVSKRSKRSSELPSHTQVCLDIVGAAKLEKLSAMVEHEFKEPALFAQALTHHSCHLQVGGRVIVQSNERLEHLGDKVVGLAVCAFLHRRFPDRDQRFFHQVFSEAVSNKLIAQVGEAVGLGELIATKSDSTALQGSGRKNAIADAMEAVACALYLDGGSAAVDRFFSKTLYPRVEALALRQHLPEAPRPPPKIEHKHLSVRERVVKLLHEAGRGPPRYQYEQVPGNNGSSFKVVVWNGDAVLGEGIARTKRGAANVAAEAALQALDGRAGAASRTS
jgi:ribonuclease-3